MKVTETKTKKENTLHHRLMQDHRPVVTMGIGISLLLLIAVFTISNLPVFQSPSGRNNSGQQTDQEASLNALPSAWPTYESTNLPISFRYPKDWVVSEKKVEDDTIITIRNSTGSKEAITVYSSPTSFFGFDGLKVVEQNLNGYKITKVDDSLFGIRQKDNFYTFDAGLTPVNRPIFKELANSIKIK